MKRKWLEKCNKVEELASQYKRHPLSAAYRPKLYRVWQPSSVWRLFPRQDPAFQFAKTCKEDVHVFALETVLNDTERRLYLVTTYTEFWFYYIKHPQTLAHCYEVIPADTVCKLYFDLEFYKPANPEADGRKMVAFVIEFFSRKLEECFGVKSSAESVLNLDSSTEEKFSRHLIFVLPNAAFKDNIHVGNFIKSALSPLFPLNDCMITSKDSVCGTCLKDTATTCENTVRSPRHAALETACTAHQNMSEKDCNLSSLLVEDKNGRKQLFIDLGVYTKNRNFRLYRSSKLGKNVAFELADDNTFVGKPPKHVSAEENIFLCALISNVRFTDSLKILTCGSSESGKNRTALLSPGSIISGNMNEYQFSPYPEIDYFIQSLMTREDFQGGIRQWNYFSPEELLVYDTVNYRWCENIGRAHRSNNVMLLVDLKREVWYQKCYDPDCRAQNFKSDYYPLPPEVCLPFILKEEDEESSLTMDENGNIRENKQNLRLAEGQKPGGSVLPQSEESIRTCDRDWENDIDDVCIAEAAEDAELADVVDHSLVDWSLEGSDIPDELLLQVYNDHDTSTET
ncbi:DNA-directed primase/polymerase protein [Mixophyes fleayi]|uniref:DNA-directed primase/polymerase protein n=1 Tax=Mixophyes fleayi TaxID=3061075 RepID=UPI003F4DCF73